MLYLSSYVQRPTSAPAPTSLTPGTFTIGHRRKNKSGGYSETVTISGVSLPNTFIYQGYNDLGSLAEDQLMIQEQGGDWKLIPQALLNKPGLSCTLAAIDGSWVTITPAELADNQSTFPITGLDFGTFSSASEPTQTVFLLNDGSNTINSLDFAVQANDGQLLGQLSERVRVAYNGVLSSVGVGNYETAYNSNLVWSLGGKNTVPLLLGPKSVILVTLTLINFPAFGLDSTSLAAQFIFNANRAGFALPSFIDWGDGGLYFTPNYATDFLQENPETTGIIIKPTTVRVGNFVYSSDVDTLINPQLVGTGDVDCRLYVTDSGTLAVNQVNQPLPPAAQVLSTFTYNTFAGTITNKRMVMPPQAPRFYLEPNALLSVGKSVTIDETGHLVNGVPSVGVAVTADGWYVPYGYVLVELASNVLIGEKLAPDATGAYEVGAEGVVTALENGLTGQKVLAYHTSSGGSGGSGTTDLSFSRSATTVTVESSTGTPAILPAATASLAGVMTSADKAKLDGLSFGGTDLSHNSTATTVTIFSSTGTDAIIGSAGPSFAGVMTSADKVKLDNLFQQSIFGTATPTTYNINLSGGSSVAIPAATVSAAGLMLPADRSKLNGIPADASRSNLSNTPSATDILIGNSGGLTTTLPAATPSLAGVMTATDKTKLNGIAAGATVSNLITTRDASTITVANSGGTGVVLPSATASLAGLMSAADKVALDAKAPSNTALSLINGWSNFGGGFDGASVAKQGRVVVMRGLVSGGTVAAGTTLCVLPVGHRPSAAVMVPAQCSGGTLRLDILANGNVNLGGDLTAGASPGVYLSLACTFTDY